MRTRLILMTGVALGLILASAAPIQATTQSRPPQMEFAPVNTAKFVVGSVGELSPGLGIATANQQPTSLCAVLAEEAIQSVAGAIGEVAPGLGMANVDRGTIGCV